MTTPLGYSKSGNTGNCDLDALWASVAAQATSAVGAFGQNPNATVGLTYGYYGGPATDTAGVVSLIASGTILVANNATNYVERTYAGLVVVNQTGFTKTNIPMAVVVTAGNKITSVTDWRGPNGSFPYFPLVGTETGVTALVYPYFDPRRFGAKVDGATDDSAAWANAITSMGTTGAKVLMPAGTSIVNAQTLANTIAAVTIEGAGRWLSTIKMKNAATAHMFTVSCNLKLRGLTLDGNQANQGTIYDFIRFDGTSASFDGEDVAFVNGACVGIYAVNVNNLYRLHDFTVRSWREATGVSYPNLPVPLYLQSGSGRIDVDGGDFVHVAANTANCPGGIQIQGTSNLTRFTGRIANLYFEQYGCSSGLTGCVDLYNWAPGLTVENIRSYQANYCTVKLENSVGCTVRGVKVDTDGHNFNTAAIFYSASARGVTGSPFDLHSISECQILNFSSGPAILVTGDTGPVTREYSVSNVRVINSKSGIQFDFVAGATLHGYLCDKLTGTGAGDGAVIITHSTGPIILRAGVIRGGAGYGINMSGVAQTGLELTVDGLDIRDTPAAYNHIVNGTGSAALVLRLNNVTYDGTPTSPFNFSAQTIYAYNNTGPAGIIATGLSATGSFFHGGNSFDTLSGAAASTFGAIGNGAMAAQFVACTGSRPGDFALASFSTLQGGQVTVSAECDTDQVSVKVYNGTGGPFTPSGTISVRVLKK